MNTLDTLLVLLIVIAVAVCFAIYRSAKKAMERDAKVFQPYPQAPTEDARIALQEREWRRKVAMNEKRRRALKYIKDRQTDSEIESDVLPAFLRKQAN